MKAQPLNTEAVLELAAQQGIDTVSELARRCEPSLSPSYLGRIVRGERPAQPSTVLALARALGVDRDDILLKDEVA